MKVKNSLKSAKTRGNTKFYRRGKKVVAVDPKNPRFKARQG